MALTGVTNFNKGVEENLKLSYKELSESVRKGGSENLFESGVDLESAVNPVEISEMGRQILEISKKLEKIEDPEKRREAMTGMEKTLVHLEKGGEDSKIKAFNLAISKMNEKDPTMLEESFRTANILSDRGYDMDRWVDAYLRIESMDHQRIFVQETRNIVETKKADESSKLRTFDRFVGTTKALHETGLDEGAVQTKTSEFLRQMTEDADFVAKNKVIDRFQKEIVSR